MFSRGGLERRRSALADTGDDSLTTIRLEIISKVVSWINYYVVLSN